MNANQTVCIDASLALAAVLQNDPNHSAALAFIGALAAQNAVLCAPALFAYECDSVIRLSVFRGSLSSEEAATALVLIDALGVILEYSAKDRKRAFDIATRYQQTRAYDAAYAAHAEALGVELVTTDKPFFEALNGNKRPKSEPALKFVKLLT